MLNLDSLSFRQAPRGPGTFPGPEEWPVIEDLKPMAEQGYMAGLLTSQAFDVQEATRPGIYSSPGAWDHLGPPLIPPQPQHTFYIRLIAKHLPLHDLMPFSFTLLVGLLEKGECADQLVGIMEAVLREKESELQGQRLVFSDSPACQVPPGQQHLPCVLPGADKHSTHFTAFSKPPTPELCQAKAIWRFLGADPTLAREVLHILLYDSPEKGWAHARQTQDRSCPEPARLPPATTRGLWELVGALGQADTLEGLEDDLFASCFLAIACFPARHLSGAQHVLPSDASPRRSEAGSCSRRPSPRGSLSLAVPLQPLLMENEPKAMRKQVVRAVWQRTEDSNIHIRGRALHGLRNAVTEFPGKVRKK
ncbi:unnamed protein product [Caretta caretta]